MFFAFCFLPLRQFTLSTDRQGTSTKRICAAFDAKDRGFIISCTHYSNVSHYRVRFRSQSCHATCGSRQRFKFHFICQRKYDRCLLYRLNTQRNGDGKYELTTMAHRKMLDFVSCWTVLSRPCQAMGFLSPEPSLASCSFQIWHPKIRATPSPRRLFHPMSLAIRMLQITAIQS